MANLEKILRQSDRCWSDIMKSATLWAIDHNGKHRTLKLVKFKFKNIVQGHKLTTEWPHVLVTVYRPKFRPVFNSDFEFVFFQVVRSLPPELLITWHLGLCLLGLILVSIIYHTVHLLSDTISSLPSLMIAARWIWLLRELTEKYLNGLNILR